MSILANLHHVTRYRYDRPIVLGPQVVRLRPAPHCRTRVVSYSLKVTPAQHFVNWLQDPNGNWLARFVFPEKTDEFTHHGRSARRHGGGQSVRFLRRAVRRELPVRLSDGIQRRAGAVSRCRAGGAATRGISRLGIASTAATSSTSWSSSISACSARSAISSAWKSACSRPEETLAAGSGSCRDSAWLLVQILRHLGLAARFVSGYLIQLRPDVTALDGPVGATQDFTDLHAWAEVYIPGAGWIGLDATSGLLCGEGHLPLAATPHFRAAAPISGGVEPAEVKFSFEMSVTRMAEKPRVTYPFSDAAWTALDALGDKVDADLATHDVRLTMGGEPTFVSIDDYQSAEWNTDALGPTKRIRADELIRKLRDRFAPGGLLHYGQGKWYPGEPLPRWAFALYWRRDGKPIWRNAALIATETGTPAGHRPMMRCASPRAWPLVSGSPPTTCSPPSRIRRSGCSRKANWRPTSTRAILKIDDPHERARIMRAFERRLSTPAGYVLPVQRWTAQATPGWISEIWRLRRGRLFVLPGDSPIGFRLPLKSLPYFVPADYPHLVPADPFDEHGELAGCRGDGPGSRLSGSGCRRAADRARRSHGARCVRRRGRAGAHLRHSGAHRPGGRAARRTAVRVHAAGRAARRLS